MREIERERERERKKERKTRAFMQSRERNKAERFRNLCNMQI